MARCWCNGAMGRTGIRWEPGRTCLPVCPALRWVEGTVGSLGSSDVELDPIHEFYVEHDLWSSLT